MDLLKTLNQAQYQAVIHDQGPLLIVAGAGTGKTTVLINRLAYLVVEKKIKTEEILLLTFTEKAAGELEERADKILPYGYVDLWIHTFHGFCERVLRENALDIGLSASFKLINETEQWILIKKNLELFALDYYRPLGNPTKFISEMLHHFSRLKDENISAAEYLKYAKDLEEGKIDVPKDKAIKSAKTKTIKKNDNESDNDEGDELELTRIKELANAYQVYNQLLLDNNFLDFGDLIVYTLKLFLTRRNILKKYQQQFKYLMVDEFQDTNLAQYELVKILAKPNNNLVVVGDDDQCLPGDSLILTKGKTKKIKDIKKGEEVASAVGKGSLSYSKVNHIDKIKKNALLLTFTTQSGKKITTTDNHKMFCFTPRISDKKYYYVYLMYRQELGWRIGMTNDLAVRLKLERSADKIVAVRSFKTLEETRYNEELLSLTYGIPTCCFMERDGIMDKKIWNNKLYQELDVDEGVRCLARDFNIDLESAPYFLEAVNRGNKLRLKINLEMCYRKYHSKIAKNGFLLKPAVSHCLSIETSDQMTIFRLEKMGFSIANSRLGKRLRLYSDDLKYLGQVARKIQKEIGGFIEPQMKIGKIKEKFLKSLIIPAKNIFPGMYLPIVSGSGIIYDQVIDRFEKKKTDFVYDLEIDRTHNFVANGVVVHNSIYKFRGASISNIMQFKDDYQKAPEIVLTENYRSRQEILDRAYEFIQNNNPNRLEKKLKINKRLSAEAYKKDPQKKAAEIVQFFNFGTQDEELTAVSEKIISLYEAGQGLIKYSDFAILVRANDTADIYVKELTRRNIPNQFMSWRGLYYKPLILDILAYFRLLDNYHESSALFRVLNMDIFKVSHADIININKVANRKVWSLFEALKNIKSIDGISDISIANVNKLLELISIHSALAAKEAPTKILLNFAYDSGLLKNLDIDKDLETFSYLNQLYQKIRKLEEAEPDLKLKEFLEAINLELEAGETGSLKLDFLDSEAVKIMTVHGSKGLEFKYVFIVNLVDKKFPTINRGEKISIPDKLVKEIISESSESDIHLEEERRLFYVAMTRAKEGLYLSGAKDYGGVREKKPSRFIAESGLVPVEGENLKLSEKNEFLRDLHRLNEKEIKPEKPENYPLPGKFSFSQLAAYSSCPLQYKFAFILKVPAPGDKASLIFGRVLHNTLYNFFLPLLDKNIKKQADLFSLTKEVKASPEPENLISFQRLIDLYNEFWQEDGYQSKKERAEYKEKGLNIISDYWNKYQENSEPKILFLEKKFSFRVGEDIIKGTIDRVDELSDGTLEIVDYKTGKDKALDYSVKRQLILYQIFLEEFLNKKVSALSYYYLESGQKASFVATEKEITKLRLEIIEEISEIKKRNFTAKPSPLCKFCDFNKICEFADI